MIETEPPRGADGTVSPIVTDGPGVMASHHGQAMRRRQSRHVLSRFSRDAEIEQVVRRRCKPRVIKVADRVRRVAPMAHRVAEAAAQPGIDLRQHRRLGLMIGDAGAAMMDRGEAG